jgi:hypothetical protein
MVRGSYRVRGLTTPFVAELAALAQMDLRDRFTRLGATVTTYADVANNPLLAGIPRLAVDSTYHAPIEQLNSATTTYVVVAPTDSQLFAGAAYRKHIPFRELARATGAVVVIPELWFNAPQLERGGLGRPGQVTASMSVGSGMDLAQASLTFITPNGETGSITLMSPLLDVERGVGTLVRLNADSARFGAQSVASLTALSQAGLIGLASARLTGGNLVIENSFDLVIGEGEYSVGVMRGAASFFKAAAAAIAQSRR